MPAFGGVRDVAPFRDPTATAAGSLDGARWPDAMMVSAVMTALTNLVSNVPAVLPWLPVVPHLESTDLIWLIIAMSSAFAGNLTWRCP